MCVFFLLNMTQVGPGVFTCGGAHGAVVIYTLRGAWQMNLVGTLEEGVPPDIVWGPQSLSRRDKCLGRKIILLPIQNYQISPKRERS